MAASIEKPCSGIVNTISNISVITNRTNEGIIETVDSFDMIII